MRIFEIDLKEAIRENHQDYVSFNDFFTRELKPGARPISGLICSPADGAVSACGNIETTRILQAKGIDYSVRQLLADSKSATCYANGSFATIYLSPSDYHRVHAPLEGQLLKICYVPGKLFSVNQKTANGIPDLFADNERLVMHFQTEQGAMAVVMVGAMIVAGIRPAWSDRIFTPGTLTEQVFSPPKTFQKGDELGSFLMGSTAIVLLEKRIQWEVSEGERVRLGEALVLEKLNKP